MSLIECLKEYMYLIQKCGRETAAQWLHQTVEPELCKHIQATVNDKGELIKADGNLF